MSDFVVVDASLAFKWLVEEENSDAAHAILQVWDRQGIGLAAPHLMPFEVTNALHRRVVRGELAVDVAVGLTQDLMSLGIVWYGMPELHGQALKLASQLRQGAVYDAHYMALAENLGCDLWTADRRFHRAAEAAGIVHWIGEWTVPD